MPELLLPVGRMVAGSMYNPNTKDFYGNPLVGRDGLPRNEYFFAVAIAKGQEQHWSQTPWGQVIHNTALVGFPNGETQRPDFSWKVDDGDSQVPNKRNVAPCNKEGYPGHWVLKFSSGFPPKLYNGDGSQQLMEADAIKNGYYIQVYGSVEPNGNVQNPGVYLNHSMAALAGYGEEIHSGPDASQVGFGGQALPQGASATPVAGGFNPAPAGMPQPTGAPAPIAAPVSSPVPAQPPAGVVPVGQPAMGQPVPGAVPVQPQSPAPAAAPVPAAGSAVPPGAAPAAPAAGPAPGNYMAPGQ